MERIDSLGMVKSIAAMGLSNQKVNPGDFFDEEGMLVCGRCHERRQKMMEVSAPTEEDPDGKAQIKTTCACKCERERAEQEKLAEEREKDMARIEGLKKASLMDEKYRDASFSTFSVTRDNARNLKLCKRFVDGFDEMVEKNQGLLFWGDVGTGKSYAAACIANELLSKKVPVVMTSLVKLLELIQDRGEAEGDLISKVNRAKLVIFDDLGAERNTDYALEKIYNIIDSRSRRKLPMVVTTNLTLDEMDNEIDRRYRRIYDRVLEVCYPMQFTGHSWRKKEASRRFREMEKFLSGE